MRITVFALASAAVMFPAALPVMGADEEQARLAIRRFKELYVQCLSNEAIKVLPRNMSGSDFENYITVNRRASGCFVGTKPSRTIGFSS
jgi:hypothetical protein